MADEDDEGDDNTEDEKDEQDEEEGRKKRREGRKGGQKERMGTSRKVRRMIRRFVALALTFVLQVFALVPFYLSAIAHPHSDSQSHLILYAGIKKLRRFSEELLGPSKKLRGHGKGLRGPSKELRGPEEGMREQSLTKRAQSVTVARAARVPWVLRARSARPLAPARAQRARPPSPPTGGVPGASLGSHGPVCAPRARHQS